MADSADERNMVAAATGQAGSASASPAAAPATALHLELFGRTDVGLVREHNEDSFLSLRLDDGSREAAQLRSHALGRRGTLLLVCDGMGGAAAGEVASSMAVETVAETMLGPAVAPPPAGVVDDESTGLARKLRLAAHAANQRIFAEARADMARAGMGTTMTAVLVHNCGAIVAQVGDSRAYVWRRGAFTQVTRDQSLVNQLLETGQITPEQAKYFEHSNVILQALGVQEDVEVQLSRVALKRGDRILVCSDGLVGVVTDEEIGAVIGSVDDPEEASRILCEIAKGAGGPDNITAIVARVEGEGVAEPAGDDDVRYELWRIDPSPAEAAPEAAPAVPGTAPDPLKATPPRLPVLRQQQIDEMAAARIGEAAILTPAQVLSMSVVLSLAVAGLLCGVGLYMRGVVCRISAGAAGLAVLADGRDTGVRSVAGETGVRLKSGRHAIELRGGRQALPVGEPRELDVAKGRTCAVSFEGAVTR